MVSKINPAGLTFYPKSAIVSWRACRMVEELKAGFKTNQSDWMKMDDH